MTGLFALTTTPTVRSPTNPPPKCTPIASRGSSIFNNLSNKEINLSAIALKTPKNEDYIGVTALPMEVIVTSPQMSPLHISGT